MTLPLSKTENYERTAIMALNYISALGMMKRAAVPAANPGGESKTFGSRNAWQSDWKQRNTSYNQGLKALKARHTINNKGVHSYKDSEGQSYTGTAAIKKYNEDLKAYRERGMQLHAERNLGASKVTGTGGTAQYMPVQGQAATDALAAKDNEQGLKVGTQALAENARRMADANMRNAVSGFERKVLEYPTKDMLTRVGRSEMYDKWIELKRQQLGEEEFNRQFELRDKISPNALNQYRYIPRKVQQRDARAWNQYVRNLRLYKEFQGLGGYVPSEYAGLEGRRVRSGY